MGNKVLRIMDANINRGMEGLRVVEDIVRFMLEDPELSLAIKNLRHKFKELIQGLEIPLAVRDSQKDLGRNFYVQSEKNRAGIEAVFRSNMKRCQEAVRVLEEFSKMCKPGVGKRFKSLRFELYDLEKRISGKLLKIGKLDSNLYVILDLATHAREFISAGVKMIQLRNKALNRKKYYKQALEISRICKPAGVTFIVNDYPDICEAVKADGVHLGTEDLPIAVARKILGDDKIIGASASNLRQARIAQREGADYIGFGPVFPTPLKPDSKATGLSPLKEVFSKIKIPVFAIGGINAENLPQIIKTGCRQVAVIRASRQFLRLNRRLR